MLQPEIGPDHGELKDSAAIEACFVVLRKPSAQVIVRGMRDWLVLMAHLIVTIIRIMAPGGARTVVAESLLLKHQLLILNRSRRKAPPLRALDRILLGLGAILVSPQRILKVAVAVRPATLLRFHRAPVRRKYPSRAEPIIHGAALPPHRSRRAQLRQRVLQRYQRNVALRRTTVFDGAVFTINDGRTA